MAGRASHGGGPQVTRVHKADELLAFLEDRGVAVLALHVGPRFGLCARLGFGRNLDLASQDVELELHKQITQAERVGFAYTEGFHVERDVDVIPDRDELLREPRGIGLRKQRFARPLLRYLGCVRENLRCDHAACPRDVFNDERPPKDVGQPRGQHAPEDVGISAGCRGRDDAHGLDRIFLRLGNPHNEAKQSGDQTPAGPPRRSPR